MNHAMNLTENLRELITSRVPPSDIHLVSNKPITLRRNGELIRLSDKIWQTPEIETVLEQLFDIQLGSKHCTEVSAQLTERLCRISAITCVDGLSVAIRIMNQSITEAESIGVPRELIDRMITPGLTLITGATNQGKTTTLASLIRLLARDARKIILLEDPQESVFDAQQSVIIQREVHVHTESFASGLREALRQDPDVIAVGELRDREAIAMALTAAETGHIVLATLHARDALSALTRMVESFSGNQQDYVRTQLAGSLRSVLAQRLIQRNNALQAQFQMVPNNDAVANLIRENKIFQIFNVLPASVRQFSA